MRILLMCLAVLLPSAALAQSVSRTELRNTNNVLLSSNATKLHTNSATAFNLTSRAGNATAIAYTLQPFVGGVGDWLRVNSTNGSILHRIDSNGAWRIGFDAYFNNGVDVSGAFTGVEGTFSGAFVANDTATFNSSITANNLASNASPVSFAGFLADGTLVETEAPSVGTLPQTLDNLNTGTTQTQTNQSGLAKDAAIQFMNAASTALITIPHNSTALDFPQGFTAPSAVIDGTDLAPWVTFLGLADPNADRVLVWDDSDGAFQYLDPASLGGGGVFDGGSALVLSNETGNAFDTITFFHGTDVPAIAESFNMTVGSNTFRMFPGPITSFPPFLTMDREDRSLTLGSGGDVSLTDITLKANVAIDSNLTVAGEIDMSPSTGESPSKVAWGSTNSTGKHFTLQSGLIATNATLLWPTNGFSGMTAPLMLVVSNLVGDANGSTGQLQWIEKSALGGGGLASADIDTSAELRAIVGDESGTGALIFAGGNIGAATATTASQGDNSTKVATTAYVDEAVSGVSGGSGGPNIVNLRKTIVLFEDFFMGTYVNTGPVGVFGFLNGSTGGTTTYTAGNTNSPGVARFSTSTSTSGSGVLYTAETALRFGFGSMTNEWRIRINELPTAGEEYDAYFGFNDSTDGGAPTDGAYFTISEDNANFVCVVNDGGSPTTQASTTALATGEWFKLRVVVNAAASSATFTINDADAVTINTGIPTGAFRLFGISGSIKKTAGTTPATIDADYCFFGHTMTTTR